MEEIPRRNAHVFSSLNGEEMASKFSKRPQLPAYTITMLRPFRSTEAFQYRRSSVGLTKSATFPSNGLFTLANSMAIALLVALDLILAMGMIVRSLPPGEYLSFS